MTPRATPALSGPPEPRRTILARATEAGWRYYAPKAPGGPWHHAWRGARRYTADGARALAARLAAELGEPVALFAVRAGA